jgi:1-acyl-sn-glycerol-3-phosphate acyltransferase
MLVRTLLFNVLFYVNFIVIAVVLAPTMLLPLRHIWFVPRLWAGVSLWLHRTICGVGEDIQGLENIPNGGFLVACKHQSTWEALRLATLFPKPAFVFKRQLRWAPLFGWYLIKFSQIPVNRGKRSKALKDMAAIAAERVEQGYQVIIFPEGTRRPPLAEPNYKYGVTYLYDKLNAPCLPIALNSGLFWPRRTFAHRQGVVTLRILPAIPPGHDADTFAAELKDAIESAVEEMNSQAIDRYPEIAAAMNREQVGLSLS